VEVQEIVPKKQRYANYNNINYNRDPMYWRMTYFLFRIIKSINIIDFEIIVFLSRYIKNISIYDYNIKVYNYWNLDV
jgi:hypothetical protein